MRGVVFRALLSHWQRNNLQLFTLLAGLALATALWSGVQAINAEARASYSAAAAQASSAQQARIVPNGGSTLSTADYVTLRRAGWLVTPYIEGVLETEVGTVRLIGVEPLTAGGLVQGIGGLGDFDLAAFISRDGYAIAGPEAEPMVEAMGMAFEINPEVMGQVAYVDIGVAARFLGKGDALDWLLLVKPRPIEAPDLEQIAPHLRLQSSSADSDIAQLTDSFHLNLTAFGLLSFAVGLFIVYGAIGLAFEQRRSMFRTLRALGVSLRDLIAFLAFEVIVLALFAGSIGIALGYVIASALLPDVAATLRGLYGADLAGSLQIRPVWWLSGLAMALGGTIIASMGTFWRLARLPLLEAGTPQAWASIARRVIKVMTAVGVILLLGAAGLAFFAGSLLQGFVLLACLLIGAALVLPAILERVLSSLEHRSHAPLLHWFWADTRSQLPGLSMALMALLLAIAANVGVSTMVSSFRLTFVGWLDQRLASEIYVTTESKQQAVALQTLLAPQVEAILPIVSAPIQIAEQTSEVFAIIDHATYRDHWPLLAAQPDVWDRVQIPGNALINEQLALKNGLGLGDVTPDEHGDEIVGVYSDYGNPLPQKIIGLSAFQTRYPNERALRFGLRVPPEDIARITALLQSELGVPASKIANQDQIKSLSLGVFEQTFTVTRALNVLTLSVAGFSMLMSLLTLSQMRLPQLAPIWALGVTRHQLGRMEVIRSVVLAALVTLLAIPLGLALAWALLVIVNVAAFGWRLPMFLFPASYVTLALAALGAACLAACWPALKLTRIAPHRLLQVFSASR